MSRLPELRESLFKVGAKPEDIYNRVFVVSAFGGITNKLLEHKKSGTPGVYALFSNDDSASGWLDALTGVADAMSEINHEVLDHPGDLTMADEFVRERIEGARSCLFDLKRLCSYGHFRLSSQMLVIRELLSGLGEAHSAFVTMLMLQRAGVNARFVDLSGWRDEVECTLSERISTGLDNVDLATELPIVTGYAQCSEGLMKEYDRGYSEVTFSRIAAHTAASEAIIHKEFHLSSADPKLVGVDAVRKLGHTNFNVADQLSNLGMEAIHPNAAKTLRKAGIPLRVTNAFDPEDPGTLIDDQPAESPAVEIVTGLDVIALELFEQDMVGVKGYDRRVLDCLSRHKVRIVSKGTNANTITHYLDAPLKAIRRVERDLCEEFPSAEVSVHRLALVSAIGRELTGIKPIERGLRAMEDAGLRCLAMQHLPGSVDVQFIVQQDDRDKVIQALHAALVEDQDGQKIQAAA